MEAILYYIHDPMCSWCWGYRPAWDRLQQQLPDDIKVKYVVGGLAPDNDQPMPEEMRKEIQTTWCKIRDRLGTEFNFDFWTENIPRRSTYMACRAVIVARSHGCEKEMVDAIQRSYYLRAMNPSDPEVLIQLAKELHEDGESIDPEAFAAELESEATENELDREITLADQLSNQGLPSLVLEYGDRRMIMLHDYYDHEITLRLIKEQLARYQLQM